MPPVGSHIVDGSVRPTSAEVAWERPSDFTTGYHFTIAWKPDTGNDWTAVRKQFLSCNMNINYFSSNTVPNISSL